MALLQRKPRKLLRKAQESQHEATRKCFFKEYCFISGSLPRGPQLQELKCRTAATSYVFWSDPEWRLQTRKRMVRGHLDRGPGGHRAEDTWSEVARTPGWGWPRRSSRVCGSRLLAGSLCRAHQKQDGLDVCPVSPVLSRKVLPPQHCHRPWSQSHKGLCPWLRCVFSFLWPALKPQSCFIDLRVISSSPAFHGCQAEHEAWYEEVWGFLSRFNDQSHTSGNNAQTVTFRKQVREDGPFLIFYVSR